MSWNRWRSKRRQANLVVCALSLIGCLFFDTAAQAGIISSSNVTITGAPLSVVPGTTTGPTPIIFAETLGGTIPAGNMPVDHVVTGNISVPQVASSGAVVDPALVKGTLAAGTAYDSYFFHFDFGPGTGTHNYIPANILFSSQILGVQLFSKADPLPGGVHMFKPAGTYYEGTLEYGDAIGPLIYPNNLVHPTRGLESGDSFAITNGGTGITLAGTSASGQVDQVRIFVASAVPEPSSVLLALFGLLGMSFLAIKRDGAIRRR